MAATIGGGESRAMWKWTCGNEMQHFILWFHNIMPIGMFFHGIHHDGMMQVVLSGTI